MKSDTKSKASLAKNRIKDSIEANVELKLSEINQYLEDVILGKEEEIVIDKRGDIHAIAVPHRERIAASKVWLTSNLDKIVPNLATVKEEGKAKSFKDVTDALLAVSKGKEKRDKANAKLEAKGKAAESPTVN